ncbi:LysR family transcriptional regulator [Paraburkholderia terrae]|uniref:LysR family transcriptional regulator n=1 Tax=Paraburkholderia terrae TaxID=311230 RepID=A0A2I8EQF9_9BURK|nr:LysR family transcriptional regulator [Paraburkholderia terrae]AUT61825.1 LysR family transcriptional regulator [Paraburkholderia terrae]BDC40230.1 LysR family transcriptional regulator [Paraburkholderia terrae]
MDTIPSRHEADLDFHHLQVFDVLMMERSITKAARVLNVTQPALSKTLARLRLYFGDPLFIRVSMRMEPTPKAIELADPVKSVLDRFRQLRSAHAAFDPATSERSFNLYLVDAGVVHMLPPLLNHLSCHAPRVHIEAIQCDAQHLDRWLESGVIDIAIGSFPSLATGIRRLPLWTEHYACVTRGGHPRIGPTPTREAFIEETHVLVTAAGTGHEHLSVERLLEAHVPRQNIVCRVPTFTSAALISRNSDAIATIPRTLALGMSRDMDLQVVEPPLDFPRIEIAQYWHDRVHRDPGNQWIRNVVKEMFGQARV